MRAALRAALIAPALWAGALPACAHDLITADAAQRYLQRAQHYVVTIASQQAPAQRAKANLDLGLMLDQIGALLNRDIAAHGSVRGLPSNYLVAELRQRGAPLAWSASKRRYLAHLEYYSEALRLDPPMPDRAQAMFALLQGYFYDSFDADPLTPRAQPREQLRAQIALGESLLKAFPDYPQGEEAMFILCMHYVQGARDPSAAADVADHARHGRSCIAEFQQRYPHSLRAAAMPMLLDALAAADR